MKFRVEKRYIKIGIIAFFVLAGAISFYYLLFHGDRLISKINTLIHIVNPVLYGIVFAYLMTPLVNGLERIVFKPLFFSEKRTLTAKTRRMFKSLMRALSVFITICIVGLCIYGFFSILIPNLKTSIESIIYQFPYYVQNLSTWAERFLNDNPDIERFVLQVIDTYSEELNAYLNGSILPQMETIIRHVSLGMIGILRVLWNFIIGLIISIYVLFSKELFAGQAKKIIYALMQTKRANQFIKDVRFASNTFLGFISGKIIDSLIIGVICFIGTSIMKTPYALLVSVVVGVTNIIPFFGPYLGAIPSALLILMVDPFACLLFIIFIVILQQVDGNIIGPKILGNSTGLSGFWVIFSITLFGGLWGILGMLVGVPLWAVVYALIRRHIAKILERKKLPTSTVDYFLVDHIDNKGALVPLENPPQGFYYSKNTAEPPRHVKNTGDIKDTKNVKDTRNIKDTENITDIKNKEDTENTKVIVQEEVTTKKEEESSTHTDV